jgi:hypothetical protein
MGYNINNYIIAPVVHCPVVQLYVAWLRGVWALLVAGRVPPLDVRDLLAGDHTVWDPGDGEAGAEPMDHPRGYNIAPAMDPPAPSVLPCGVVPALLQPGWPMYGHSSVL